MISSNLVTCPCSIAPVCDRPCCWHSSCAVLPPAAECRPHSRDPSCWRTIYPSAWQPERWLCWASLAWCCIWEVAQWVRCLLWHSPAAHIWQSPHYFIWARHSPGCYIVCWHWCTWCPLRPCTPPRSGTCRWCTACSPGCTRCTCCTRCCPHSCCCWTSYICLHTPATLLFFVCSSYSTSSYCRNHRWWCSCWLSHCTSSPSAYRRGSCVCRLPPSACLCSTAAWTWGWSYQWVRCLPPGSTCPAHAWSSSHSLLPPGWLHIVVSWCISRCAPLCWASISPGTY